MRFENIDIDLLYFGRGWGAPDGLRHVKRMGSFSIVECVKGYYSFSIDQGERVRIDVGEMFVSPAGALQDIIHRVDENGEFECRYIFINATFNKVWKLEQLYNFPANVHLRIKNKCMSL